MYVIIESGGKQYKLRKGEIVNVDKLNNKIGEIIELNSVMMVVDKENVIVGKPLIENAKVVLEVVRLIKDKKVVVFKYKPKKGYKKIKGHRQQYTSVKVKDIKIEK